MNYKESVYSKEPIHYCGKEKADIRFYDGALSHAAGVKQYQVIRANREFPQTQDDYGWTYNHAPMLCYWKDKFFLEYLSDRIGEHLPPSQTLLTWSSDGEEWEFPAVVFPQYTLPEGVYNGPHKELLKKGDTAIMHQRMGFYVTNTGRLLILGFYGVSPNIHTTPNNGYGIARVVREVYEDLTFSPVYVIKYNEFSGFNKDNIIFPHYTESKDSEFINGCEELLKNKLITRQWWEEQRFDTELFSQPGSAAFCFYTLDDNRIVGLYKNSLVNISSDGGKTWGDFQRCPSIETSTGKMWGEKTSDGKFALCYNPSTDSMHRWPLAVATSSDGINFSKLLALTTYVSPTRYEGDMKNLGPQYVRGICEGYPKPDDGNMWLTYSMDKEDIWVCKVPVPVTDVENEPINEDFSDREIKRWSIYSPKWCKVSCCNGSLTVRDSDPYDKAIAERGIIESLAVTIETQIQPECIGNAGLYVDLTDKAGQVPVRILFANDFNIYVRSNGVYNKAAAYCVGRHYKVIIKADCIENRFTVEISCDDGVLLDKAYKFSASVYSLKRLAFQTKDKVNLYDLDSNGKDASMKDLPNSGVRSEETRFNIRYVKTSEHITENW